MQRRTDCAPAAPQWAVGFSPAGPAPPHPPRWAGKWLEVRSETKLTGYESYTPSVKDDVIVALKKANGDAIVKCEPLALARSISSCRMHRLCLPGGRVRFQDSGRTVGKRKKAAGAQMA